MHRINVVLKLTGVVESTNRFTLSTLVGLDFLVDGSDVNPQGAGLTGRIVAVRALHKNIIAFKKLSQYHNT